MATSKHISGYVRWTFHHACSERSLAFVRGPSLYGVCALGGAVHRDWFEVFQNTMHSHFISEWRSWALYLSDGSCWFMSVPF